jgi:hypothetical protein
MPTEKQRQAVKKMVENGGIASRAMRDVGYSKETAKSPHKLTESKGFKEICEECGLTEKLIVSCLTEDINKKPQNRKPELELAARMRGLLKENIDVRGELNIKLVNYADNSESISSETIPNTTT